MTTLVSKMDLVDFIRENQVSEIKVVVTTKGNYYAVLNEKWARIMGDDPEILDDLQSLQIGEYANEGKENSFAISQKSKYEVIKTIAVNSDDLPF